MNHSRFLIQSLTPYHLFFEKQPSEPKISEKDSQESLKYFPVTVFNAFFFPSAFIDDVNK